MDPLTQAPPIELPHDIQTPELISQFPVAIGWWLLTIIIITFLVITISSIKKYRANRVIQRQAIEAINISSSMLSQTLSTLKWAAMGYFPRQEIASLSGESLFNYLTDKLPESERESFAKFNNTITQHLYNKGNESAVNIEFNTAANHWLKTALPPKATKQTKSASQASDKGAVS